MSGHGGSRPGAGRPARAKRTHKPIVEAEQRCIDRLPQTFDHLEYLANGGYEQVTETWEPAATIMVEQPLRNKDGSYLLDKNQRPIIMKQQAFPDAGPDVLVLVKRVVEVAAPDRTANIYLADRAMGKPTERIEADVQANGTVAITTTAIARARDELAAWRANMLQNLSTTPLSLPSAPPTPPILPTPTDVSTTPRETA